eukprot:COSAG05_NODE_9465_length_622_cov_0.992352_1_plen_74_part_00
MPDDDGFFFCARSRFPPPDFELPPAPAILLYIKEIVSRKACANSKHRQFLVKTKPNQIRFVKMVHRLGSGESV